MRILAVMGSYRKGRCVDKLVDEAIAGALSAGDAEVDKVTLIERRIEYCRNCLTCRDNPTDAERAPCAIRDDMDEIAPQIERADAFIFGSSIAIGTVTAVMKTFLDRTGAMDGYLDGPGYKAAMDGVLDALRRAVRRPG